MKRARNLFLVAVALGVLLLPLWQRGALGASPKLDCGPVTDKSSDLPRTVSIGTNPAGTGAHSIAASLAAFVPALLFYVALFVQVDLLAGRQGLRGLPPRKTFKYLNFIHNEALRWGRD